MNASIENLKASWVEQGPFDPTRSITVKRAMIAALELAHIQGQLESQYPWVMALNEVRELKKRTDVMPPGGWRALASVMAATGFLSADSSGFYPNVSVSLLESMEPEDIQEQGIEGFTQFLAPPQVAASLLVALGMHPFWGLRVVRDLGCPHRPEGRDIGLYGEMMPASHATAARQALFAMIASLLACLRALEPDRAYSETVLSEVIIDIAQGAREMTSFPGVTRRPDVLALFHEDHDDSIARVAATGFWDELTSMLLIPCGVVERAHRGVFSVDSTRLRNLEVDGMNSAEQDAWLRSLLGPEPLCDKVGT